MAEVDTLGLDDQIFPNKPGGKIPDDRPQPFTGLDQFIPDSLMDTVEKSRRMFAGGPRPITLQEFLVQEEENIAKTTQESAANVQERVFEEGLSGETDFNSLFSIPLIEDANQYELIKQAKQAETDGNASPDQVALLNDARNGQLRKDYDKLLPENTDLYTGVIKTGQFPLDAFSGEVIIPKESGVSDPVNNLQRRAEDALELKQWMESRPDAPTSPKVRKALLQAIESDMDGAFAERIYSLINATKEGVGFWLPKYAAKFYDNVIREDLYYLDNALDFLPRANPASAYTPEAMQKELMEFRQNFPAFADRQKVMNDILRDQLRLQLGQTEFDRLGLGEKITVDGVENYKVNFVGEKFAEDMFEKMFDMQSFPAKLGVLISENLTAYNVIKAPVVFGGNMYRGLQRGIRQASSGNRNASFFDVPFKYQTVEEQALAVATRSQLKNIPITSAATQLANEAKFAGWLTNWRTSSFAQVLAGRAGAMQISTAQTARHATITDMTKQLIRAQKTQQPTAVLEAKLNRELALQNWSYVRKRAPYAREYGITPLFDTVMATSQIMGRNFVPDNPQLGELFGVAGMMGIYGTAKLFQMQRVPFVGHAIENVAFRAKVGTEAIIGAAFELMPLLRRGQAEGRFVNPNLKAIVNMPEDMKNTLSVSELRAFDVFTKGLMAMGGDPQVIDKMLDNISQTLIDADKVVRSLPEAMQPEVRAALKMNIGQASQMNVFFSMAAALDASTLQTTPKGFLRVQRDMRHKLEVQLDSEKQIAAMGVSIDRLNAAILKLRESGDPTQAASASRLEILSSSFKKAYLEGTRQQKLLSNRNLREAERVMADLENPNLSISSRKQSILSGKVDNFIRLIRKADKRFDDETARFAGTEPEPPIATAADTASQGEKSLTEAALTADEALGNLSDAVIKGVGSSRLPANAAEIQANASDQILQLVALQRTSGRDVVQKEYDKISTDAVIEFDTVASPIMQMFNAYKVDAASSIAKSANPLTARALGGATGERMMQSMNDAAERGLIKLFADESVLKRLSDATNESFNSPSDVIGFFKNDYFGSRPGLYEELGVRTGDEIRPLQLALLIMSDKNIPGINARELSFVATPREMEDLRQAANRLIKDRNPDKQNIGRLVLTAIDDTLEKWGSTLNVEDYNQLARARVLARLETQRFDDGTLGRDIEKATASDIDIILGGGEVTKLTKGGKQVLDLIKPLIDNIVNPTENSTAIVRTQMRRLTTTFSSLTPSVADSILVKGADGKFRIPNTQELADVTFQVIDLEGFNKLRAIIGTAVKNEFLKTSGMGKVQNIMRVDAGTLRVETPKIIDPADMPKAIEVPPQFNGNLTAYLESIEDQFTFMVKDKDGKVTEMKLFDTDELLTADRDVVDIVHLNKQYQQTHADLLSIAKSAADDLATTEDQTQKILLESLGEVNKSSGATVGREFYEKVLLSGDANSVRSYLQRSESAIGSDKLQNSMQALFTETILYAGEFNRNLGITVKMFNGQNVPVNTYNRPDIVFSMLDDAMTGATIEGRKLKQLADAAGVDDAQLETLHAIFRLSTKLEAPRLVREAEGSLKQSTKGFTLDNTLSKAFNLARGMVSKEYVAAEAALRYAAMGKGRIVSMILKDKRSADIIYNVLSDETRVAESDALYLAQSVMKFIAGDLARAGVNFDEAVVTDEYIENYWKQQGVVFDFEEPRP